MGEYRAEHWSRDVDPESAITKYLELLSIRYQKGRNALILSKFIPEDLSGQTAIDYGCGIGHFTIELAKRGATVTGFDVSPEAIYTAKYYAEREGVSSRCTFVACHGDFEELRGAGACDFILAKDIIEHVPNDVLFVTRLVEHLKPGGALVITTPNYFSLDHLLDVAYYRWHLGEKSFVGGGDPTHVRLYATSSLYRLVRPLGLRRTRLHGVGIVPGNLVAYATLFRCKRSFYSGRADRFLGGVFPFSRLGAGQLNLFLRQQGAD